jgi:hypothetical protein
MKIINEKGKLFGIINIVDLLLLIAVIGVIGGVGWKLLGPQVTEKVAPQVEMTADMVVIGTPPRLIEEIERQDPKGQRLVAGNEYMPATIEDVTVEDYVVQAVTADGRIVNALDPSKKDVVFTIKAKVPAGTPNPKIGSQEVKAGKTFILKTQTMEVIATIRRVVIDE